MYYIIMSLLCVFFMILPVVTADKLKSDNAKLKDVVKEQHLDFILNQDKLNGRERFAADGLATQEECETLMKLASAHSVHGDGYDGASGQMTSPHTDHEMFEGLTLVKAAELAASYDVKKEDVELFSNMILKGHHLVKTYYKVVRPLYIEYTHLVCRTAVDDSNTKRTDLSHPVHADNCNIQPDSTCKKEPPAYTHRDYSAFIYLNEDITGGEFFFAHQNKTLQYALKPKCGRIVSFNSANYHGVKAVLKGRRCALGIWFTFDPDYEEGSHPTVANRILKEIKRKPIELMRPDQPMGPDRTEL